MTDLNEKLDLKLVERSIAFLENDEDIDELEGLFEEIRSSQDSELAYLKDSPEFAKCCAYLSEGKLERLLEELTELRWNMSK